MKVDILAIGVHPDDVELGCSGTILKAVLDGKKVAVLDLTQGELGTRGTPELRQVEAHNAAKILGVTDRVILNIGDGFFQHTNENMLEIVKYIRHYQPDVVLANAMADRHPDHGRAGKLISEACFYSGLQKIETSLNGGEQKAHRPKTVYHYIQDRYTDPDLVVDVTEVWDKKIESILAYSSQFFDPNSKEPETPISSKAFLDFIDGRGAQFGRLINTKFGEGYTMARPAGVNQILDVI
ncbi:MAG: bacillithiol biosynthesis deacetylase BshB1 [Salibacteraceae bacterium]|jgi:bacillithiol biosynthesis deacetylase BshB1